MVRSPVKQQSPPARFLVTAGFFILYLRNLGISNLCFFLLYSITARTGAMIENRRTDHTNTFKDIVNELLACSLTSPTRYTFLPLVFSFLIH